MFAFLLRHPWLVVCLLLLAAAVLQVPLVAFGHPVAVWLWCDLAALCGGAP